MSLSDYLRAEVEKVAAEKRFAFSGVKKSTSADPESRFDGWAYQRLVRWQAEQAPVGRLSG